MGLVNENKALRGFSNAIWLLLLVFLALFTCYEEAFNVPEK